MTLLQNNLSNLFKKGESMLVLNSGKSCNFLHDYTGYKIGIESNPMYTNDLKALKFNEIHNINPLGIGGIASILKVDTVFIPFLMENIKDEDSFNAILEFSEKMAEVNIILIIHSKIGKDIFDILYNKGYNAIFEHYTPSGKSTTIIYEKIKDDR